MNIFEFYSPQKDKSGIAYNGETRKPVITFSKLAKLKKMRDMRKIEDHHHDTLIKHMYGPQEEEGMGGGTGMGGGGPSAFGGAPDMGGFDEMGDMDMDMDMGDEMGDMDMDMDVDMDEGDLDLGDEGL